VEWYSAVIAEQVINNCVSIVVVACVSSWLVWVGAIHDVELVGFTEFYEPGGSWASLVIFCSSIQCIIIDGG
jgi:hypothetical protein